MNKLTLPSLALLAGVTLVGCSEPAEPAAQEPSSVSTPPPVTSPEPVWTDPAPAEVSASNPYGLTEEELDSVFLMAVDDEHHDYTTTEIPDETLLSYGKEVCPALTVGTPTDRIVFPGLTEMDNAVVVGAAVGTWCPDQIETLYAEAGI